MPELRVPHPTPTASVIPNPGAPHFTGIGDQFNTSDADSLNSLISTTTTDNKKDWTSTKRKSKYTGSHWKQQNVTAWVHNIHLLSLAWYLLPIGGTLQLMGLSLYLGLDPIRTEVIPYTFCTSTERLNGTKEKCADIVRKNPETSCTCNVTHHIKDFPGTLDMNFELFNFHQNQRDYIIAVDEGQLQGKLFDKNCKPIQPSKSCITPRAVTGKPIYPCGKYPNSLFSDEVQMLSTHGDKIIWKPLMASGSVAMKKMTFVPPLKKSPKCKLGDLQNRFSKPQRWSKEVWDEFIDGVWTERFIMWMRPAAFSTFRIPYRRFNGFTECSDGSKMQGICNGTYTFNIKYRFEAASFGGRKAIIISHNQFITDGNNVLLTTMLTVGTLSSCIGIVALIFLLIANAAAKLRRVPDNALFSTVQSNPPIEEQDKDPLELQEIKV